MTDPVQDALYYPNIHITNDRWLKTSLLTFPHVIRMTPHGFDPDDSPLVARLSEAYGSRGEPLVGRYDLNSPEAFYAIDVILEKLRHDIETDNTFRQRFAVRPEWLQNGPSSAYVLHENKLGYMLQCILEQNGLAVPLRNDRGWLAVHPRLASAFMSCVAAAAAKDQGLEIVTDAGVIHETVGTFDTFENAL